jgi:hypothetical protein
MRDIYVLGKVKGKLLWTLIRRERIIMRGRSSDLEEAKKRVESLYEEGDILLVYDDKSDSPNYYTRKSHAARIENISLCGRCDSIKRGFEPLGYIYPVSQEEAETIIAASEEPDRGYIFRCASCGGYVPVV